MDKETKEAFDKLSPCKVCEGYPILKYEPGATYAECVYRKANCPAINICAADYDPLGLAEKINQRNK